MFYLETDASCTAVGAVLSQQVTDGNRQPIGFFSAGLTPEQRRYAAGELEAWDHNPLAWLRRQKDPARQLLELETLRDSIEGEWIMEPLTS